MEFNALVTLPMLVYSSCHFYIDSHSELWRWCMISIPVMQHGVTLACLLLLPRVALVLHPIATNNS